MDPEPLSGYFDEKANNKYWAIAAGKVAGLH
jgi:hypothetical protein